MICYENKSNGGEISPYIMKILLKLGMKLHVSLDLISQEGGTPSLSPAPSGYDPE